MFRALDVILWLFLVAPSYTYTIRQIYQFSDSSFTDIENVATRSNGQLLLNLITEPSTYYIDPTEENPTAKHLYTFPRGTSLTGIAEYESDVFGIVVGNYSVSGYAGVLGSFSVWSLDFRSRSTPIARKIADIPEAQALNGMTAVQESPGLLLIADSALGLVWSLNVSTGKYQKAIEDPLLGPTEAFPLGINGLHVHQSTLFFTNSAQGLFGQVQITNKGNASGKAQKITSPFNGNIYDDFALDQEGNAWITNHPSQITEVTYPGGKQLSIAGGMDSTQFVQPTSATFGRGSQVQQCTLYVVGAGMATNTSTTSGQVVAINTC